MSDVGYAETLDEAPDDSDGLTIEGEAEADQPPAVAVPVSALPTGQQFDVISNWWRTDADHSKEWRAQARECFSFRAGEQWTDADKAMLQSKSRPVIVFNRVLTILKAVAGMEINGRHEIAFLPRGTEDTKPNEVLTAASKWMGDTCDGEDEESQAFDQTITTGMGWVEERMSYEDDPAGLYVEEMVDCREMYWDRTAKKKNLSDSRREHRVRRMPFSDAVAMFPGFSREQLDAVWAVESGIDWPQRSIEEKRKRDADNTLSADYDDLCEVTIVQTQWIEREPYWIVADLATNSKAELSQSQYERFEARMKALGMTVEAVRLVRKVYKQAFLGGQGVMLKKAGPSPIKGQFSWKCITAEFDAVKGTWFGLVKILRDPQMWANKWLSQILHILNSTAKGGILAERSAADDEREFEDGYAQPDEVTWLADGALSGDKPKVMPKPGAAINHDAYLGLLTFAISSFKDVTGINLELLGQQDQNQPGILEAMRKQAGMTVLATLFDSLRRFRKQIGRSRLFFIQNFLADGRLIRVVGNDNVQAIPLAKDKTFGMYDVVVDDTPTSPNQKEANWLVIQPLLVVFKEQLMGNPRVLAMLLEYSPLPSRIVDAVKQFIEEGERDPEQRAIKEVTMAGAIAKIEKDKSTANLNNAKAGGAQATAVYEIAFAQNLLQDNKREELSHYLELMKDAAKAREAEQKSAVDAGKLAVAGTDAGSRRITAVAGAHEKMANVQRHGDDVEHQTQQRGHERVGMLIDHLATRAKAERDVAGAHKDRAAAEQHMAAARLADRTPATPPAGA